MRRGGASVPQGAGVDAALDVYASATRDAARSSATTPVTVAAGPR
jgi:(S)-ureidoglycine-glyoxylate aminotransferase